MLLLWKETIRRKAISTGCYEQVPLKGSSLQPGLSFIKHVLV